MYTVYIYIYIQICYLFHVGMQVCQQHPLLPEDKVFDLEIRAPKSQVMSARVQDAKVSEFEIALSVAILESNTKVILNHSLH